MGRGFEKKHKSFSFLSLTVMYWDLLTFSSLIDLKAFYIFFRAVKVNALIYEIIVAEINAIKYFDAVNATLFTSGVRCPLTRKRRVPMQRPRFTDDTELLLLSVTLLVNTNMSHFLFLTLTLQQPPRLLHSPSSFTTDPPTNQPMRACYPTQPHPIGLELSHVPPRPVHWRSGHLSTYLSTEI